MGFPSSHFLQELSSEEKMSEYCSTEWGITFPITEKVKVNDVTPTRYLKSKLKIKMLMANLAELVETLKIFSFAKRWGSSFQAKGKQDDSQSIDVVEKTYLIKKRLGF